MNGANGGIRFGKGVYDFSHKDECYKEKIKHGNLLLKDVKTKLIFL